MLFFTAADRYVLLYMKASLCTDALIPSEKNLSPIFSEGRGASTQAYESVGEE